MLNIKDHTINKILLLKITNNLVCSYGEDCQIEIFSLEFDTETLNTYKSLQKILDPHYYSIEYLYETNINSNNKNYLLICSDMIHVFYLYDNDTKSILLQSINEFNYRYINQVIELRNGNLISYSNEYKISVFQNLLIENDEYFDDLNIIKNNNRKEIYLLDKDKINKKNEIILYLLELYPNKFAYCYKIDDGEFTRFLNNNMEEENEEEDEEEEINEIEEEDENNNNYKKRKNRNMNNNSDNYIYLKFLDKEYNFISELEISKVNKDIFNMFQYNENIMVFIKHYYLTLIDLNHYEIITKIKTGRISFSYFFTNNILNNNFINYLILRSINLEESLTSSDNDSNNSNDNDNDNNNDNNIINYNDNNMQEDNNSINSNEDNNISDGENYKIFEQNEICFYDLKNLIYGIKKIKIIDNKNKEIILDNCVNPDDIIDISITPDNKNKNYYYLSILLIDYNIWTSKFKIE